MRVVEIESNLVIPQSSGRTSGIHQSSIIKAIALRTGHLDLEYEDDTSMSPEKIHLGLAWEEHVSRHVHPDIIYHPGEVEKDGIIQTCDGLDEISPEEHTSLWLEPCPDDYSGIEVNEFKMTWKSCRPFDDHRIPLELAWAGPKWWMWLTQLKGYCKTFETRHACLRPYFVNGRYEKGIIGDPKYRCFKFVFEQFEIDENWDMLVNNRHLGTREEWG